MFCCVMALLFVVFTQIMLVQSYSHQKPVPDSLWTERCKRNSYMLNDCNWCWCNENHYYTCKARICEQVDVFGHFKDTIQEIDVGMEGHGVWRSTTTVCTPGVQYRRGTVFCRCDEDGNWPNPVCRDLFRILHSVEVTEDAEEATSQICSPTKLYLVGCNVCFCPATGKLFPTLCTNRTCAENDPVLAPKEPPNSRKALSKAKDEELEIYADCLLHKTYTIGCQKCKCHANNRLICDECKLGQTLQKPRKTTLCSGKIGSIIYIDCNSCKCHSNEYMYCTTKKCLPRNKDLSLVLKKQIEVGKLVDPPIEDHDCVARTSYHRGCNTCYCQMKNRNKLFQCTVKSCRETALEDLARDCVKGTSYEKNCYICSCDEIDGERYEACRINNECLNSRLASQRDRPVDLDSLHGYCEPLHEYRKKCNNCKCLANGKIVKCTTNLCVARSSEPLTMDIVPLLAQSEPCPSGHTYRVGCNVCFCLSNGNALCTTAHCSKRDIENKKKLMYK